MIAKFSMLLEDQTIKQKYEQALRKQGLKCTLSVLVPYMVKVDEDKLKIIPLQSFASGVREITWDAQMGVFDQVQNTPCPLEVELLGEDKHMHILITALIAQDIDNDQFIKGLKLDYTFDHAPCKFIVNYLTNGIVFRGYADGSYEERLTMAEFLVKWSEILLFDFCYQYITLEPEPKSIVGRLKAYR